jgi:hypothetical protein
VRRVQVDRQAVSQSAQGASRAQPSIAPRPP